MWPWILIAGIAAAVLVVFAVQRLHPDVDHMLYPRKYESIVKKEAKEYDLPQSLVYAVIKAESDFDPEAESPVGALGLMQMMPETFDWMQTHIGGEYDASALLDPEISIKYGCALLRVLLNEYDNLATCPEEYILWFHHLPWNYRMKSGRTLWGEMTYLYNRGVSAVESHIATWHQMKPFVDNQRFEEVDQRLKLQEENARLWRDTCLRYFSQFAE